MPGRVHASHVVTTTAGQVVCERCRVAGTFITRLKGLLGRSELRRDEGLLVRPAPAVHTWFMRFPIDAVFVDGDLAVVGVAADLRPWRMAARRGAAAVLELSAGEADRRGIRVGDRLVLGVGSDA
jgi:uncharacterized membrane protein (UPF0127 family)